MLIETNEEGSIHGFRIEREASSISHLFFVDDSVILYNVDLREDREVKVSFLDMFQIS